MNRGQQMLVQTETNPEYTTVRNTTLTSWHAPSKNQRASNSNMNWETCRSRVNNSNSFLWNIFIIYHYHQPSTCSQYSFNSTPIQQIIHFIFYEAVGEYTSWTLYFSMQKCPRIWCQRRKAGVPLSWITGLEFTPPYSHRPHLQIRSRNVGVKLPPSWVGFEEFFWWKVAQYWEHCGT